MPYTHVFATHAMLQEHLVDAIIREEQIPVGNVLVIRMRKSFRAGELRPYRVLNGDRFNTTNGRNIIGHRLANRKRCRAFTAEVLTTLAPDFVVFSPMYTYWYLNVLAARARAYHILEDGFASYQSLESVLKYVNLTQPFTGRRKIQRQLVTEALQRTAAPRGQDLLDRAGRFYVTSDLGFPWVRAERRVVVPQVFAPYATGEYTDALVWGPGCLVEAGLLPLPDYLALLTTVLNRLRTRGVKTIYYKLHPTQVAHAANHLAYQQLLATFAGALELIELDQSISIECLAAGNKITLVTGFSTLSFHVAQAGGEVLTYLEDILLLAPGVGERLGADGRTIFGRISEPI